jgi:hypothetical protein
MKTRDKESSAAKSIILRHLTFPKTLTMAMLLTLTACGGGGSSSDTASGVAAPVVAASHQNVLTITADDYGLLKPNFYYSTDNAAFWSIQANVATDVYDQDFRTVIRIDITKTYKGSMPALNKTFSIEDNPGCEKFPGVFSVFNGQKSVYNKVERGTISFTPDSDSSRVVHGVFDIIITDYDSKITPPPQYHVKGVFSFDMGTYGVATPLVTDIYPAQGKEAYDKRCAACHSLGDYNSASKSASDLSQRGRELPLVYPGTVPEHQQLTLDVQTMQNLRVFLNAW